MNPSTPPTPPTPSPADFFALESRLIDAEVRQSRPELEALLASGFREIGTSGRLTTRAQVLASLAAPGQVAFEIENLECLPLGDHAALVTYRATARRTDTGQTSRSARATVWTLTDAGWQAVFHQGSRIAS